MSRSAGRVLIRPLGDYDATETYEILDCVEYEGTSYVCKQTSTGNLPTNKTYWQKLCESGSIDPNAFMAIDGSNATKMQMGTEAQMTATSISKPAGEDQTVTIVFDVATIVNIPRYGYPVWAFLYAHIDDETVNFLYNTSTVFIKITGAMLSIGVNNDTVTVTAKLVEDVPEQIYLTNIGVRFSAFSKNDGGFAAGNGSAVRAFITGQAFGSKTGVIGMYGHAEGQESSVGDYAYAGHAEGIRTYCNGDGGHTEGRYTKVTAQSAHAEGFATEAGYENQHVCGKWNDNKSNTLFEVGGGAPLAKSNVFEVYNNGAISMNNGTDKYKFCKQDGKDGFVDGSNNFNPFDKEIRLTQSVTLSTTDPVTVTFTNNAIKATSWVDVGVDTYGIVASDVVTTTGQSVVTFAPVEDVITINVCLKIS